jgi:N-[(2S)-2-amino-2-carboxyethyl]-L-glutamate dehydrogenase
MPEPELRVLDRGTVQRCVAAFDPLDAVESVLRSHAAGETVLPAEAYMEWSNRGRAYCRSIAMPGGVLSRGEPVYGMKIINAAVSNPAAGLDRAGGVIMLFDPETARPRLLADAGFLSALRTAAYTMLSLRYIGPHECDTVSIIGCGVLAREHLRLLARYYPAVSAAYMYDIDQARAAALAAWAKVNTPALAVARCASAREAVAASRVLFTLTTSRQPYIEPDWFQPGSFVAHVSLDDVTEAAFRSAEAVYADDLTLIKDNPRRILGRLMAEGKVTEVAGTLGEVMTGIRQATRPRDGVVISNPFGMSILDVGLLEQVARTAAAAGLGRGLRVFGNGE